MSKLEHLGCENFKIREVGDLPAIHFKVLPPPWKNNKRFQLKDDILYYSHRYRHVVHVEHGFLSDGATCATDIMSLSWWVHDKLCETKTWADGTPVSAWESSMVLYDILKKEGYRWRAPAWAFFTYLAQKHKKGWRK